MRSLFFVDTPDINRRREAMIREAGQHLPDLEYTHFLIMHCLGENMTDTSVSLSLYWDELQPLFSIQNNMLKHINQYRIGDYAFQQLTPEQTIADMIATIEEVGVLVRSGGMDPLRARMEGYDYGLCCGDYWSHVKGRHNRR